VWLPEAEWVGQPLCLRSLLAHHTMVLKWRFAHTVKSVTLTLADMAQIPTKHDMDLIEDHPSRNSFFRGVFSLDLPGQLRSVGTVCSSILMLAGCLGSSLSSAR